MTLPPFDGPRARQATATLTGAAEAAPAAAGAARPEPGNAPPAAGDTAGLAGGAPRWPAGPPGSPAAPGAPPATSFPPLPDVEPESLNLARRPFVNTRPVERVAAILWVAGVALLVANVTLFMRYLTNSQATRGKLAAIERDIAQERRDGAQLQGKLGNLGLEQQNREVTFLNRKIDERTFSWSLLFDRMAEVLPDQVRLLRLKPNNVVQREIGLGPRPSARELNPPPVTLAVHCEAKDDEAVLRFVDNLFAHPAFAEPNLESEERQDNGRLRFDLTVQYQSNAPVTPGVRARPSRPSRQSLRPAAPAEAGAGVSAGRGAENGAGGDRAALPVAPAAPVTPAEPAAPAAASPAGAGLIRMGPPPLPRPASGNRLRPGGPRPPRTPGGPRVPGTAEPPGEGGR